MGDTEKRRGTAFRRDIALGVLGAIIGLVVSPAFPGASGMSLLIGGFFVGLWASALISSLQKLWARILGLSGRPQKAPRQHYRLPKEMRDGYYEGVVMKRIMQVYHPEAMDNHSDEETQSEQSKIEDADDHDKYWNERQDRFEWPSELTGKPHEEYGEYDTDAGPVGDRKSKN